MLKVEHLKKIFGLPKRNFDIKDPDSLEEAEAGGAVSAIRDVSFSVAREKFLL